MTVRGFADSSRCASSPKGKTVVLGLCHTQSGMLESPPATI